MFKTLNILRMLYRLDSKIFKHTFICKLPTFWILTWRTLVCLLLAQCTSVPEKSPSKIKLTQVSYHQLPGWHEDDFTHALKAMKNSCKSLLKKKDSKDLGVLGKAGDWKPLCKVILTLQTHEEVKKLLEDHFHAYHLHDGCKSQSFCTGYYEPHLRGSVKKSKKYHHPLYKKPKDLKEKNGKTIPHLSRKQIEEGLLAAQNLELLWVDCPIDAFFLEIQGSGQILLEDGRTIRVGYDGKNGHPYTPIGRILIEQGALTKEKVSMQSIRKWLKDNPHRARDTMHQNASHVFFRLVEGDGPIGSQGVALTPERSLAVDPAHLPLGSFLWIDLMHPLEFGRLQQLVVAQDTGGAIKGPLRGDLFWGAGDLAAYMAGHMKSQGDFYLLIPKKITIPQELLHVL